MGASDKTGTLELSQYVTGDKLNIRGDYNADMRKIDQGHVSLAGRVTEGSSVATTALSKAQDALTQAGAAESVGTEALATATAATASIATLAVTVDSATTSVTALSGKIDSTVGVLAPASSSGAQLNALLAQAALAGLPLILAPKAVMSISEQIVIPANTRLLGNGATLVNRVAGGAAFIVVNGVSNVVIENLIIDGKRAEYTAATEWRHGISISNSEKIVVRDVVSKANKGDGFYIGDQQLGLSRNISMHNVLADGNYRQGISISHARGVVVTSSRFINTSGTLPESGVDIEPNVGSIACEDIKFIGCEFSGNAGYGILIVKVDGSSAAQRGYSFTDCISRSNTSGGVRITDSDGLTFTGGQICDNQGPGVIQSAARKAYRTVFSGVSILRNGTHGAHFGGLVDDLRVVGCTIMDNGRLSTGDGFSVSTDSPSSNFVFVGNVSGGTTQRYGVSIGGSGVAQVSIVGNSYPRIGTKAQNLSTVSNVDTRLVLDNASRAVVAGSRGANAALLSLITALELAGIVTNSTTA